MRADHNAELSFRDAMRFAIVDQLNAFRLASTKTGTRGQKVWDGENRWHALLAATAERVDGLMPLLCIPRKSSHNRWIAQGTTSKST